MTQQERCRVKANRKRGNGGVVVTLRCRTVVSITLEQDWLDYARRLLRQRELFPTTRQSDKVLTPGTTTPGTSTFSLSLQPLDQPNRYLSIDRSIVFTTLPPEFYRLAKRNLIRATSMPRVYYFSILQNNKTTGRNFTLDFQLDTQCRSFYSLLSSFSSI